VFDDERNSLQWLVEQLCRCDATFESVERVELKELGEAHDVIVFSLRGHPEKAETAYAWCDHKNACHRVVTRSATISTPEAAVRSFSHFDRPVTPGKQ
jgi:hypothetical protein